MVSEATAHLRPGGELSYIFVLQDPESRDEVAVPESELRIYDVARGRLRLTYRLRPMLYDGGKKLSWGTFSIATVRVADFGDVGVQQILAVLGLHSADAEPQMPVTIRWRATNGGYSLHSVFSGENRPHLHGAKEWQRGYSYPQLVVNEAQPQQRFHSGWAESVGVEGRNRLLGVFYGHARGRVDPEDFEVAAWSIAEADTPRCIIGSYPGQPLFIKASAASLDEVMTAAWRRIKGKTECFF